MQRNLILIAKLYNRPNQHVFTCFSAYISKSLLIPKDTAGLDWFCGEVERVI